MDDIVATLALHYTSDLVAGTRRDEAALTEFSAQAEATGTKASVMGKAVESSSVNLETAARRVSTLGLTVGVAAAALDAFAAKAASDFNAKMLLIQTQAGASAQEMEHMKAAVLGLSGPVAQTPNDLADALFHLESAGLRGVAAENALAASAKLADIGHANLEQTTNALIAVTESHIKGIKNQTDAAAQLNAVVGVSNTRLGDLVAAMGTGILPTARAVGLSFQDIGGALGVMTTQGVPAVDAATRLRMTLMLMEAPTAKAQKALESVGVTQSQLAEDMRSKGLLFALTDLEDHLRSSGLTAIQQSQVIAAAFGGGRTAGTILTLLQNLDMLKSKVSGIGDGASKFGADWVATTQEVDFQWKQLQATAERLAIEVGDTLLPTVRAGGNVLEQMALAVEHVDHVAPGLITALAALGIGVGGLSLLIKAALAVWAPYSSLIALFSAAAPAAAAGEAEIGAAAAAATPPLTAFATFLGITQEEMIATGAVAPEASAGILSVGAAAGEGAAGLGLMSAAVGVLTGPVGLIALAAAIGIIAYERIPGMASQLNGDFDGAVYGATEAVSGLGTALDAIAEKIRGLPHFPDLGIPGSTLGSTLGTISEAIALGPYAALIPILRQLHSEHQQNIADLEKEKELHQQLIDAQRQGGFGLPPTGNNPLNAAFVAAGAQAPGGVTPGSLDYVLPQITTLADAAKQFATEQKSEAANLKADEAAMADSMLHGKGDLDAFRAAAVHDQVAVDQHAAKLQTAAIQVDRAAGDWGAALKGQIAQDTATFDNARGKLVTAIDAGSGNIHQLAEAAARANDPLLHLTKSGTSADAMIAALTGNTAAAAKAARDFATNLSQAASTSFANLVKSAYTGKGNEGQLFEKAVGTKRSEDAYTQVSNTEKQKVDKAAGDWADWLVQERQKLQSRVDAAEGKLIADQRSGNRAALPGDESRLKSAESSLASFQTQTDAASNAVKKLAGDPITQAQDKAKTSLEALQLAIADGDGPGKIHKLTVEAQRAAEHLAKLGLAGDQAALKAGSPSDQITAIGSIAKSAADALVMGIDKSESPAKLKLLSEQADKAAAAAQRLSEAQNHEAQMVGTPSERLSAHDTSDKSGLANAEATITLAIEHHRRVTEADITAAQAHQRAVDADAAAAWNASYAAASTAERHRLLAERAGEVVSQFNTLKGAVQSVTDAERTVYEERTTLIKDALDAMLKSFEDATAVFQAESAASKDAGGAIVTAIDDQTAVFQSAAGTFSSILDAIKSGNNASLALMESILQVAHDQFQVSLDQQALDAVQATWQQKIDADNVKLATDKATLDTAQAAATIALGRDQLILDHDKVKLAQDQLKLTELTNKGIELIASHFGDVSAYDKEITSVLRTISTDSSQINSDQQQLDSDTRLYDSLIANATLKLDQDQRQLAQDQSSSDAGSAAGQARISGDKQRLAADQALQQGLQALAAATQAVTDSFNQLASDESKTVVDGLNEMVTAVSDATSVFQAMAGVGKAGADGQIKAIQDQSAIIKAQGDIAVAQTAAQLVIGRDELVIADDQLQADQMAAAWNVRIALDQVKIATDKAATDALKSQWDHTIDLDTLQVDKDKIKLAQDQLSLTVLTNAGIDMLAQLLGGDPSGYEGAMTGALQQINADQSQIATDQARQVQDQQLAAQQEAQAALQAAYDQQQLARDQAASDASSQAGQMRIAQDQLKLTADQVAQQMQTNALLSMSLTEMQAWFAPMLDAMRNLRSGVDYHWVGSGPDPFQQWQNSAPAQFAQNPSYRG